MKIAELFIAEVNNQTYASTCVECKQPEYPMASFVVLGLSVMVCVNCLIKALIMIYDRKAHNLFLDEFYSLLDGYEALAYRTGVLK